MVGWLDRWSLVGFVVGLGFGLQGIFWVSGCCCVYFKFLGFFFHVDFIIFLGLICGRIRWRKGILNEFLHVLFAEKM